MTEPILAYQTPQRPTGLRTACWILLLIFGISMCLLGTCGGTGLVLSFTRYPNTLPAFEFALSIAESIIIIAATLGSGITYLCVIRGVRRCSLRAGKTALIMVYVNLMLILLLVLVNVAQTLPRGVPTGRLLAMMVCFYGLACLPDCFLVYCLRRAIREQQFEGP